MNASFLVVVGCVWGECGRDRVNINVIHDHIGEIGGHLLGACVRLIGPETEAVGLSGRDLAVLHPLDSNTGIRVIACAVATLHRRVEPHYPGDARDRNRCRADACQVARIQTDKTP